MNVLRRLFGAIAGSQLSPQQVLQSFQSQRQKLQHDFFQIAASSGKPRGLRWSGSEWLSTFALVYDSQADLYTLFCGVNLSFEAIEGGDMEDVAAVSAIRDGSAVFHCRDRRWGTGGRVLFNVDPQTAARTAAAGQELLLAE